MFNPRYAKVYEVEGTQVLVRTVSCDPEEHSTEYGVEVSLSLEDCTEISATLGYKSKEQADSAFDMFAFVDAESFYDKTEKFYVNVPPGHLWAFHQKLGRERRLDNHLLTGSRGVSHPQRLVLPTPVGRSVPDQ